MRKFQFAFIFTLDEDRMLLIAEVLKYKMRA